MLNLINLLKAQIRDMDGTNFNFHSNSSKILISQCNSYVSLGPKSHDPMSKTR